ncbi:MAG: hypothetical protein Kow0075_13630 [Salibacteraceae bacterium]
MNQAENNLETLAEIRDMMTRSSRFISLSGLAGVISGIFALIGAGVAWYLTQTREWVRRAEDTEFGTGQIVWIDYEVVAYLLLDAMLVFMLSLAVSFYLTRLKAKRKKQPVWGPYSRQLLINLSIPLLTGAAFCVALFSHGLIALIAPTTLVFYGLALINAGKYSFEEISLLGMSEIVLGLIGLMFKGQGLLFWTLGFGVLHIVYGIVMYYRHDRS